ncbi:MAG: MBL fold metallo-hydrolase [Burkholderiales bacterium]
MRFSSLGSGSEGNGLVVENASTRVLLDCGFSIRETQNRLSRIGLSPEQIDAILVTHEHDDHVGGVFGFARKHGIPVYLSHGTLSAHRESAPDCASEVKTHLLHAEERTCIGDLEVLPFTVPHDAREPLHYVFSDGDKRLGVLTDTGCSTTHIEQTLSGLDALVLETNHDLPMLMASDYPQSLKARIAGRLGHLDNQSSGALLAALDRSRLKHVIAAHLSKKNNAARLARSALALAMGCELEWIGVATQNEGFDWREI